MKNIVFITNHMGIQGSYLNHLDLQQYLKDHEDYRVKFYCKDVNELFKIVKNTRRSYTFNKEDVLPIERQIVEPDIVITDFKTFLMAPKLDMWVICDKLIIMDSIELTYHLKDIKNARFFYDIDMYKVIEHYYANEILFLMPPNNHKLFVEKYPDLNSQIFFKNINIDMLKTIKFKNRDGYFFRWDDLKDYRKLVENKFGKSVHSFEPEWIYKMGRRVPLKYNEINHVFDYKSLIYRRRKYLEYQEQFGRLIFEYILLGKTVYFLEVTHTDDGLTDYLNHFDIKFEGNKIITTKEELQKRMENYNDRPWL